MKAEDGSSVDVSGIYWFVIAAVLLFALPLWASLFGQPFTGMSFP
jgi:hypothetical protein